MIQGSRPPEEHGTLHKYQTGRRPLRRHRHVTGCGLHRGSTFGNALMLRETESQRNMDEDGMHVMPEFPLFAGHRKTSIATFNGCSAHCKPSAQYGTPNRPVERLRKTKARPTKLRRRTIQGALLLPRVLINNGGLRDHASRNPRPSYTNLGHPYRVKYGKPPPDRFCEATVAMRRHT